MQSLLIPFFCCLLLFCFCQNRKGNNKAEESKFNSSFNEIIEEAQTPLWLSEKVMPIDGEIKKGPYKRARKGVAETKEVLGNYLYLTRHGQGHPYHPFWNYVLGLNLLRINEDQLAYKALSQLIDLPDTTVYTNTIKRLTTLDELKELPRALRIRILAKQGFVEQTQTALQRYVPKQNYAAFNCAVAAMLIGEHDQSIALLQKALEPDIFIRLYKRSSATAGAVGMAYAMGRYEEVFSLSEWMIKLGKTVTDKGYMKFDDEGKRDSYSVDQWESSFDIVQSFRELAFKAKKGDTFIWKDLKDGSYHGSCRGFIDTLSVSVLVRDGVVSHIEVISCQDDRPFTTEKIIPKRIMDQKSLKIDAVTSATITSYAIVAATAGAVISARK